MLQIDYLVVKHLCFVRTRFRKDVLGIPWRCHMLSDNHLFICRYYSRSRKKMEGRMHPTPLQEMSKPIRPRLDIPKTVAKPTSACLLSNCFTSKVLLSTVLLYSNVQNTFRLPYTAHSSGRDRGLRPCMRPSLKSGSRSGNGEGKENSISGTVLKAEEKDFGFRFPAFPKLKIFGGCPLQPAGRLFPVNCNHFHLTRWIEKALFSCH